MSLRYIGALQRYSEIEKNCSGTILNLGSELTPLHSYLKNRFLNVYSADIEPSADYVQDLNNKSWKINRRFDTIVAGEILEHMENPLQFLNNCYKLLKVNGKLVLTTPNATSLIYLVSPDWCTGRRGKIKDLGHIVTFTSGILKELFVMSNFKVVYTKYLNIFLNNPFAWIICQIVFRLRGDIIIVGERKQI